MGFQGAICPNYELFAQVWMLQLAGGLQLAQALQLAGALQRVGALQCAVAFVGRRTVDFADCRRPEN